MKDILVGFLLLFGSIANAQQQFQLRYQPFPVQETLGLQAILGGGYLLVLNESNGTLFTRFDDQFNVLWNRKIDSVLVRSLWQSGAGDLYLICNGTTIVKTDSILNVQWKNTVSYGTYQDLKICETSSGHIFVGGSTRDINFDQQYFITCLNKDGFSQWSGTVANDTIHGSYSFSCDLVPSLNGSGKILAGLYYGDIYDTKCTIIELDTLGNVTQNLSWTNSVLGSILSYPNEYALFGLDLNTFYARIFILNASGQPIRGMSYNTGIFNSVSRTSDGGFVIGLKKNISFQYSKPMLLKVDSNLSPLWCRMYSSSDNMIITSVLETGDKGYLISGKIDSSVAIIKTDSLGYSNCNDLTEIIISYPGIQSGFSFVWMSTNPNLSNNISLDTSNSIAFTSFDTICFSITHTTENLIPFTFNISPNPAKSVFRIDAILAQIGLLKVFNLSGVKVYEEKIYPKSNIALSKNIDASEWPVGIYIIKLQTEKGVNVKKLIIE